MGGPLDVFHLFTEALSGDPDLVQHYNTLKLQYDRQPMAHYRAAKDVFIENVLKRDQDRSRST